MCPHRTIRRCIVTVACGLAWSAAAQAQTSAGKSEPPASGTQSTNEAAPDKAKATAEYISAMDALEAADYDGAAKHLDKALAIDPANGEYLRARGVAYSLGEKFPAAITDLKRAIQLKGGYDPESDLWLGAAYQMSDDKFNAHFANGGDIPADYASLVYLEMATTYRTSRYDQFIVDSESVQQHVDHAVKAKFPVAARWYANRHKATGHAAAQALLERVKANMAAENWAAALHDLHVLEAQFPNQNDLAAYWPKAELGVGDLTEARTDYTFDLSFSPEWVEGYLGRAKAEAMLGDQPRMEADLQAAADAGAKNIAEVRASLTPILNQHPVDPDALAHFQQAAASNSDFAKLVDSAVALRRWANSRRLRYDQAAYAAGDYRRAYQLMQHASIPSNASPEARGQFEALRQKVQEMQNR